MNLALCMVLPPLLICYEVTDQYKSRNGKPPEFNVPCPPVDKAGRDVYPACSIDQTGSLSRTTGLWMMQAASTGCPGATTWTGPGKTN